MGLRGGHQTCVGIVVCVWWFCGGVGLTGCFAGVIRVFLEVNCCCGTEKGFCVGTGAKLSIFGGVLTMVLIVDVVTLIIVYNIIGGNNTSTAPTGTSTASARSITAVSRFITNACNNGRFGAIRSIMGCCMRYCGCAGALNTGCACRNDPAAVCGLINSRGVRIGGLLIRNGSVDVVSRLVPNVLDDMFANNVGNLPPDNDLIPNGSAMASRGVSMSGSLLATSSILTTGIGSGNSNAVSVAVRPGTMVLSVPTRSTRNRFFGALNSVDSIIDSVDILSFSSNAIGSGFIISCGNNSNAMAVGATAGRVATNRCAVGIRVGIRRTGILSFGSGDTAISVVCAGSFPTASRCLASRGYTENWWGSVVSWVPRSFLQSFSLRGFIFFSSFVFSGRGVSTFSVGPDKGCVFIALAGVHFLTPNWTGVWTLCIGGVRGGSGFYAVSWGHLAGQFNNFSGTLGLRWG